MSGRTKTPPLDQGFTAMAMVRECANLPVVQEDHYYLDIVSQAESGEFKLNLPPLLEAHEPELESLLVKVFSGRPKSPQNLALAQQLSLNWALAKCREKGLSFEECFED